MTMPFGAVGDGPRITVDAFIKDPLLIRALVLDMMRFEFIIDAVLRNAGGTESGVVRYEESTPLLASRETEVRADGAEVPLAAGNVGALKAAFSVERALGIMVTDAMRRRMNVDPVNRQLTQVRNQMIWDWSRAFWDLINNSGNGIQRLSVGTAWDMLTDTSAPNTIRGNLSDAIYLIEQASADDPQQSNLGFQADTLIINHVTKLTLFKSEDFAKPYLGDVASDSIQYTGKLPRKIMNLDVLESRQVPLGNAIVMQRNRCGFRSDEVPLNTTPLYRDEPRKMYRADVQRATALGLDQPKAIVLLDNVDSGSGIPNKS